MYRQLRKVKSVFYPQQITQIILIVLGHETSYIRLISMDSDAISGSIFLKLWLFNAPKMMDNKANIAPNNFVFSHAKIT